MSNVPFINTNEAVNRTREKVTKCNDAVNICWRNWTYKMSSFTLLASSAVHPLLRTWYRLFVFFPIYSTLRDVSKCCSLCKSKHIYRCHWTEVNLFSSVAFIAACGVTASEVCADTYATEVNKYGLRFMTTVVDKYDMDLHTRPAFFGCDVARPANNWRCNWT